jgi:osmotically-inducible protein OsmY
MHRYNVLVLLVVCALTGCDGNDQGGASRQPDNTAVNERDRNENTTLPSDQSNDPTDLEITQRIRQAVVDLDNVSLNAQNIKIITVSGHVTLRGPVEAPGERDAIVDLARRIAGTDHVTDELEVTSSQSVPNNPRGSQP